MEVEIAVARLNSQLPLKVRQNQLSPEHKAAHLCVLNALINQARPPSLEELQKVLGDKDVKEAIERLSRDDLVVSDVKSHHPVGAYPLTTENTPHTIRANGQTIHAMCALDAVSVAPMFDVDVIIESRCHLSGMPISINMHGSELLEVHPGDDVMVGIRWQMPSTVAAHSMCREMVFLKDRPTAEAWQTGDTENISLFTLCEAVAFGKCFFRPLIE